LYTISTGLPPCSLHVSLSCPIASVAGSSIIINFPPNVYASQHDTVSVAITLWGAGFSIPTNTPISLVVSPASSRAQGTAIIFNSDGAMPLLVLTLQKVANSSLISATLPSVTTPHLPQGSRADIRFSAYVPDTTVVLKKSFGFLSEILPPLSVEVGQPVLRLTNNAARSTTTVTISLSPTQMLIPDSYAPSALLITLIGAGWLLPSPTQGRVVRPLEAKLNAATITAVSSSYAVLRVDLSGIFPIRSSSTLQLLVFNLATANFTQPEVFTIHSAILNSAGSVIANGTRGILDSIVESTMGLGSPVVTLVPPLASSSAVDFHVSLTPMPRNQNIITLPARIIITLTGSEFVCGTNTIVKFTSPFDAAPGRAETVSVANKSSILTISVTSGTFLPSYPILLQFGPCSASSRVQPPMTGLLAAMIDKDGMTLAATASGTLDEIYADLGQPNLLLSEQVLRVMLVPRVLVPARSFLVITLTGMGLVCEEDAPLLFSQPAKGASGSATIVSRPLESVIKFSFFTQFFTGTNIVFNLSPVYGGCFTGLGNATAALIDTNGRILATTALSFSESTARPTVTVQQLIGMAVNGVIFIPQGTYAGKCNCGNVITNIFPVRPVGAAIQMNGIATQSVIDCSGTGLRCLIVRYTSVTITNITFRGGSSPSFIPSSTLTATYSMLNAENPHLTKHQYQIKSKSSVSMRRLLQEDVKGRDYHDRRGHNRDKASRRAFDNEYNEEGKVRAIARNRLHSSKPLRRKVADGSISAMSLKSDLKQDRALSWRTPAQSNRPNAGFQHVHRSSRAQKGSNRQLLQSVVGGKTMFSVVEEEAGGCIFVTAPDNNVILYGVSLFYCSSVYGGGGFFNVSSFDAKSGQASNNLARQGGGIFVAASNRASIELFEFLNNTVVTSSISSIVYPTNSVSSYRDQFSKAPDPAAAAGGGAWFQTLTLMRHCTFKDNAAIATASVRPISSSVLGPFGSHALGSGVYILQTSLGSVLSSLMFLRSISICSGGRCVSAGSMFIHFAALDTTIASISFIECRVQADGRLWTDVYSFASGACFVVADPSAGSLNIKTVLASNCSAISGAKVLGGCISFLETVKNSVISDIVVSDFTFTHFSNGMRSYGGIFFFPSSIENTTVTRVAVNKFRFICETRGWNYYGSVIYAHIITNTSFSSISLTNYDHKTVFNSAGFGVFTTYSIDKLSALNNIYIENVTFSAGSVVYGLINAFVTTNTDYGHVNLRDLFLKNITVTTLSSVSGLIYLILQSRIEPSSAVLHNVTVQDCSVVCNASKCFNYGLILVDTNNTNAPVVSPSMLPSFDLSHSSFQNIAVQCIGRACFVGSGCIFSSVRDGVISNVRLNNVAASSNGGGSSVGGAFLFHAYNDPLKTFLIQNVNIENTRSSASGKSSLSMGGAIAAVYGNLTIQNCRFLRTSALCTGESCQSLGGALAFVSTLGFNPRRSVPFSVLVSRSEISNAANECSGLACNAAGGAMFVSIAYRGPYDFASNQIAKVLAFKGLNPQEIQFRVENCKISQNTLTSNAVNSTLTGAGIAMFFATGEITQSSVTENAIHSSKGSALAAGSGIYATGLKSSISVSLTDISLNSAGEVGLGGAIFVGQKSVVECKSVIFSLNTAAKGGGLMVDEAVASLSSCKIFNNSASDRGGGLFCVASQDKYSALMFSNVGVFNNYLLNGDPAAVGSALYIFGNVFVDIRNGTRIELSGNSKYTTTEAIVSVSRQANILKDTITSCSGGSVLAPAPTHVESQRTLYVDTSIEEEFETQCSPACLYTSEITSYVASSGFLASCIPCPRGTYSITASSIFNDSVASMCLPCPFGAVCHGGSNITAAQSHWGWKISDHELTPLFVRLPSGFACEDDCSTISPCAGHRAGILCGACAANYSIAFFQTHCVLSSQCAAWKWVPLLIICFLYQFLFSVWIYWSSETGLVEKQDSSRLVAERALRSVPLFDNLSIEDIAAVVSKMELVHFAAKSTIISQGHPGSFMYIIEAGVLSVSVLNSAGVESRVATLGALNAVGELSLINGTNCNASIRAEIDSELWRLDRSCLDHISEEDKSSFVKAKLAQYAKPADKITTAAGGAADEDLSAVFGVLMWFYQLVGIMLSVTSPLEYLDGSAIAFSIISFFVNSQPSSDAASDVSTKLAPSPNDEKVDAEVPDDSFKFCVSSSFNMSQMYIATFLYYILWAGLMLVMSQKRVWKFIRRAIIHLSYRIAQFLDAISGYVKQWTNKDISVSGVTLREQFTLRENIDIEIRGPAILKWFITCFSAMTTLMMQGTACYRLNDFRDADDHLRWIYDGRVACFSDSGDLPGRWQVAPAFGVALCALAPAVLWRITSRIKRLEKKMRLPFQETLLEEYSSAHSSNACHWMVVM
jgi:hypothetical protein